MNHASSLTAIMLSALALAADVISPLGAGRVHHGDVTRPAMAISSVAYDGTTYDAGESVPIFRQVAARVRVSGPNLQFASGAQVFTTGGTATNDVTATLSDRALNTLYIVLNSNSSAGFREYEIRIRYPVESNGPDVFKVRLYQRGSISSFTLQAPDPNRLDVGQKYTLTASGTDLDHVTCCTKIGQNDVVSLTAVSRTSTSATFSLVMNRAYSKTIEASHFYDNRLASAPSCGTPCFTGSGKITVGGVLEPTVASVSPRVIPAAGSTLTISGNTLAPEGYSVQLMYYLKYRPSGTSSLQTKTLTGTNSALSFSVPEGMLGDSLSLNYTPTGANVEPMSRRLVHLPSVFLVSQPKVAATNGKLAAGLNGAPPTTSFFTVRSGPAVIYGENLLSAPTTTTTTTSLSSGTTLSRTAPTTLLVPIGTPLPPTVSFGSTSLPVQSAGYFTSDVQTSLAGTTVQGADRVAVNVPDLGTSQLGTLSVKTSAGTATLPNVLYLTAPRVTSVNQNSNSTESGSSTRTLYRGVSYTVVGSNLYLLANSQWVFIATLTLNGIAVPVDRTLITADGSRATFTVPTTAQSGSLILKTPGGTVDLGTYTAADRPTAPIINGFVLSPSPVVGGSPATASVAFAGAIPTDGSAGQLVVTVNAADYSVVPSLAAVPINASPVTFQIPTLPVTAQRVVTVYVKPSGANTTNSGTSTTITVNPPQPTSVTLSPSGVTGGKTATGSVQINASIPASANYPVALSSSDPTTVSVPATVTINGNTASFTATTNPVTSQHAVTINASIGGVTKSTTLTVDPPALSAVSLALGRVVSGRSVGGTITFTAAGAGTQVQLTSNDAAVSVPSSVTVTNTTATFTALTQGVSSARTATITATAGGISKTVTLALDPILVQSVAISPSSISAGGTATITVRLSAGSVNTTGLFLTSSDTTVAKVPALISFSDGQDAVVAAVTAKSPIAAQKTVTISVKATRQVTSASGVKSAGESTGSANVVVVP